MESSPPCLSLVGSLARRLVGFLYLDPQGNANPMITENAQPNQSSVGEVGAWELG